MGSAIKLTGLSHLDLSVSLTGLSHLDLSVSDRDVSARWYADAPDSRSEATDSMRRLSSPGFILCIPAG
jgi:hypothetical protein